MLFDFLKKYSKFETLISWKYLYTDEEWYKLSAILYRDCIRFFDEKKIYYKIVIDKMEKKIKAEKDIEKKLELKMDLKHVIKDSENIRFDYGFYGKCAELRLANIFKEERIRC